MPAPQVTPMARVRGRHSRLKTALVVTAFLVGAPLSQMAQAQSATARANLEPPRLCAVVGRAGSDGPEQEVIAQCWGTGLILGRAERYRTFLNFGLKVTLVELERSGEVRVLLLREGANGQPQIEDVTGSLAVAAGRAPWAKLDGLALDFGKFAGEGRIGLRAAAAGSDASVSRESATRLDAPASEVVVDIGEQIAGAQAGTVAP